MIFEKVTLVSCQEEIEGNMLLASPQIMLEYVNKSQQ